MNWDLLIALAQLVTAAGVIPTIMRADSYVPRSTSLTLALGIGTIALGLFGLGVFVSGGVTAISALLWVFVFARRGDKRHAVR